ncbi:MAG: OmpA family protein [Bacteroidales bacterium]|nr:OmpA family protein [Bacteroidales bacterium]
MKGIKMILGALAAASLLISVSANAQENTKRGPYETNKAFDNTFIGVGAGINATFLHPTQPSTWGNVGLAVDVNFGKWWTPFIGGRLGWHGMWNNSKQAFDAQGIQPGTPYGFHYFHGDVLWNISNTIGGYKPRFWDFVPYATMGLLDVSNSRSLFAQGSVVNHEFSAGIGLLNVLRVTERVNITLDLMALIAKAHAYSNQGGRIAIFPSATIGLNFNLGQTGFKRHSEIAPAIVPVPFTVEQYNDLAQKAADLEKQNATLRDKVAALENKVAPYRQLVSGQTYVYENGTFTAIDVKPGAPITLYFDCGSAKLSAREKAHLEYFIQNVVNENTKISVNAYADKQTGSAKRNQQLSEQRAKTVVDLLKQAGANEANIECAAHGATVQLFNGAAKNRVATIEVK